MFAVEWQRERLRADLLYFSARAGVLVCDHGSVDLVRGETFRVAPDDVTAEAGGEGGAEAGGGAGAGVLEEGRDGGRVGEDVACKVDISMATSATEVLLIAPVKIISGRHTRSTEPAFNLRSKYNVS